MVDELLVPVDRSDPAREALSYAFSEFPETTVRVLHAFDLTSTASAYQLEGEAAVDPDEQVSERRREIEQLVERIQSEAADHGQTVHVDLQLHSGSTARAIVDYAEEHDVDHVVIGSHGRTGSSRILLGSVAEKVVRRAPVPVTVVR